MTFDPATDARRRATARTAIEGHTDGHAAEAAPFSSDRARALWQELFGALLSVQEAAEVLQVDRSTVMRWLRDGELRGCKIGRTWHLAEPDLRAFVRRQFERTGWSAGDPAAVMPEGQSLDAGDAP